MKRLYVRPEANGNKLRRAIVDVRIKAARHMGWTILLVNAIQRSTDMLRIYETLAFEVIDRHAECSDPIEVDLYCVHVQLDLF